MLPHQDLPRNPRQTKDSRSARLQVSGNKGSRPPEGEGVAPAGAVIPQCQHTKADGLRCGSPALRGKPMCYHHARAPKPKPYKPGPPDLRNPLSVLRWTMDNLIAGRIDRRTAGQIIYAVQELTR